MPGACRLRLGCGFIWGGAPAWTFLAVKKIACQQHPNASHSQSNVIELLIFGTTSCLAFVYLQNIWYQNESFTDEIPIFSFLRQSWGRLKGLTVGTDLANYLLVTTKEGTIYAFKGKEKNKYMGQNETKFCLYLPKKEMKLRPDLTAGNQTEGKGSRKDTGW